MKLAIACDHAAYEEKKALTAYLESLGHFLTDCGCDSSESVDYPDYAEAACQLVQNGEVEAAILLCGTGIGMSMAANKMKGIRAALLHNTVSASFTRQHNDANVACFGARVTGMEVVKACAKVFCETGFEGGRHSRRVEKINALDVAQ